MLQQPSFTALREHLDQVAAQFRAASTIPSLDACRERINEPVERLAQHLRTAPAIAIRQGEPRA